MVTRGHWVVVIRGHSWSLVCTFGQDHATIHFFTILCTIVLRVCFPSAHVNNSNSSGSWGKFQKHKFITQFECYCFLFQIGFWNFVTKQKLGTVSSIPECLYVLTGYFRLWGLGETSHQISGGGIPPLWTQMSFLTFTYFRVRGWKWCLGSPTATPYDYI